MNPTDEEGPFANMPPVRPGEVLLLRGLVTLVDDGGERPGAMLVTDQRVVVGTMEATETSLVFSAALLDVQFGWPADGGLAKEYAVVAGAAGRTKQVLRLRRHPEAPEDALALFEAIHDAQHEATPPERPPSRWRRLTGWPRRHG